MTDIKPLPTAQREPKPLTPEQQKLVDKANAERDAKRQAAVAERLPNLLDKFGPKHTGHPAKEKKVVQAFDPFAPREAGDVDWDKQRQDTSQRRTAGKRKNVSGKK